MQDFKEQVRLYLPKGWQKLGYEMVDEIESVLSKMPEEVRKEYKLLELKEKYCQIRWYANIYIEEIEDIVDKYSDKATDVCIVCGDPVKLYLKCWLGGFCGDCFPKV